MELVNLLFGILVVLMFFLLVGVVILGWVCIVLV